MKRAVESSSGVNCQSRVRSEGRHGGQDRVYTVQCCGLPMTTSRRREWTEIWGQKVRRRTGTLVDPQTEELGNEHMSIE